MSRFPRLLVQAAIAAAVASSPAVAVAASSAATVRKHHAKPVVHHHAKPVVHHHPKPVVHHRAKPGFAGPTRFVGTVSASSPQFGYYIATAHGNVFQKGGAKFYGSPVNRRIHLTSPVVSIAATPRVPGYAVVTAAGQVMTFGKLHNYGSLHGKPTSKIVAIALRRDGQGYWLVAANGTVTAFGHARVFGTPVPSVAMPVPSRSRVVAMLVSQDSRGYLLVTANGGVFAFGDAHNFGSASHLTSPVVSAAYSAGNRGYYLATANGGVRPIGHARFLGSAVSSRGARISAIASTVSGSGYRLLRVNGAVLLFGGARPPAPPPNVDPLHHGSFGYDVSWPQCGQSKPDVSDSMVIVGINDGRAFTTNPCLGTEWHWAQSSPNHWIYVNTNLPAGILNPFSWGEQAAQSSLNTAARMGIHSTIWWLDVETTNFWAGPVWQNADMILGVIHQLRLAKVVVGVYSTHFQWGQITGGVQLAGKTPQWIPGAPTSDMASLCGAGFTAGPIWMTQGGASLDIDYAC